MNKQQRAGDRSTAPVIVALGGNALAPDPEDSERRKLPDICQQLAGFVKKGLLITHGNGPQIGLLAEKFSDEPGFSLAGLNAQTEGWLGHAIETELSNVLTDAPPITTLLTSVETDPEAEAASAFAERTGNPALVGSVNQLADLLQGRAGTCVLP